MGYFYPQNCINKLEYNKYSDKELLEGIAQSKESTIAALYAKYHLVVKKWIISRGGIEEDADDAFQEAVIVLFHKSKQVDFVLTCKLETYVFGVAKRIWLKKIAKQANAKIIDIEDTFGLEADISTDIAFFEEKEMAFEKLNVALSKLGSPCNELLKLFYIEKKSMQEISESLNYNNTETAKVQKYKCLNRLRKIFFTDKR